MMYIENVSDVPISPSTHQSDNDENGHSNPESIQSTILARTDNAAHGAYLPFLANKNSHQLKSYTNGNAPTIDTTMHTT